MVGYIKLFPENSISFTTNGLGSLNDCLSCFVEEERNGIYELTMTYPVTGRRYSDLANKEIIFCKSNPFDTHGQPFRIYSISKPINGQVEVSACHISYDMRGYPVSPFKTTGIGGIFTTGLMPFDPDDCALIANCPVKDYILPFTFWTDKHSETVNGTGINIEKPSPMRTILGGMQGSVLDTYQGEFEFDQLAVRLWQNRGQDRHVVIRYGKNLTDFKQEENCNETYTGVYPYWWTDDVGEDDDIANEPASFSTNKKYKVDDQVKYLGEYYKCKEANGPGQWDSIKWDKYEVSDDGKIKLEKLVELPEKVINVSDVEGLEDIIFDHAKVLVLDTTEHFKDRPTIDQLRDYTKKYIKNNDIGFPKVSIDLSFVSLEKAGEFETIKAAETIMLCDTIKVYFPKMNITANAKCIKYKYNVLTDRYDSISLGSPKIEVADTIASTIMDAKETYDITRSAYGQAVINATRLITGHTGGHVILNPSDNPREIIISEKLDYTADDCKIWVWNMNGLGFSEHGYFGNFEKYAITKDGQLNASAITTGFLDSAVIEAGSIKASAISQEYMAQIKSEITGATDIVTQQFKAADGVMLNNIEAIRDNTETSLHDIEIVQSELKQSIDGLDLSFKNMSTGGLNLVKNSVGLNASTDWITEGMVTTFYKDDQTLEDTISGSEWCLYAVSNMLQTIKVKKGKSYILSLKYKVKHDSKSYVTLTNGDNIKNIVITGVKEYSGSDVYRTGDIVFHESDIYKSKEDNVTGDWDETKWQIIFVTSTTNGVSEQWMEAEYLFTANAKTVDIFMSSEGNGFYVSDLMLVEGTVPHSWTPANGEVYGENVKIDVHGINITNTDSEFQTLINHEKFAVQDYEGNELLRIHPDYTWLMRTRIKNELDVGQLRIMPTDTGAELMIVGQEVES